MEQIFRKHFWAVQAALFAVAAFLSAAGINAFGASFLMGFAVALPEATTVAEPVASPLDEMTDLPADLFGRPPEVAPLDPCGGVVCAIGQVCNTASGICEAEEEEAVEEVAGSDGRCIPSDIALTLVGTQVSPTNSAWSMAVFRNPAVNRTQFAQTGTTLLAEAEVLRIERNRVIIRRNGREECIRFGTPGQYAAPAAPAGSFARGPSVADGMAAAAAPPTPGSPDADGAAPVAAVGATIEERIQTGVRRNRDGSYDVDRSVVREVANNQALLEQEAPRVVPNYVNGEPRGYRLQGIRSGSMFSRIGIRNGDVITRVGDTDIDSPQRALELYQQMMNQSSVSVTVLRRGREQTLTYNIR